MTKTFIKIFPNVSKKSAKTGKIPMYLRLKHNGIKSEIRLPHEITIEQFKYWHEITEQFDQKKYSTGNQFIASISKKIDSLKVNHNFDLSELTSKDIIDYLLDNGKSLKNKPSLLLTYVDSYIKNHIIPNQSIVAGTKRNYLKAQKHFNNFIKLNKLDKMLLSEFTFKYASAFKTYLMSDKGDGQKAMTDVSASSIITKLKPIFNHAINEELIFKNPFKSISISNDSKETPRLNVNELYLIYKLDCSDFPELQIYKDIFLFGCFTGLSHKDIESLNRNEISETKFGKKIDTSRSKTGQSVKQFLINYAANIVSSYNNNEQAKIKGLVLPYKHINDVNKYYKILAKMSGVKKLLSTKVTRCTCRQLLSESGIKEQLVINSIMGWTNKGIIDAVYSSVTENVLNKAKEDFELYLTQNFTDDNPAV